MPGMRLVLAASPLMRQPGFVFGDEQLDVLIVRNALQTGLVRGISACGIVILGARIN